MLQPRDTQPWHARAIDRAVPSRELFEGEAVAFTGFIDGQQSTVDGGDHLGLAPDDPALRIFCGRDSRVSASPSGPMTAAGRIF